MSKAAERATYWLGFAYTTAQDTFLVRSKKRENWSRLDVFSNKGCVFHY